MTGSCLAPLPDRPVVFLKYYEKASTILGADQIAEALRARGAESRSIPVGQAHDVRDSIVVFIKKANLLDLLGARRRGNRVVIDVQDTVVFKRFVKHSLLAHGLLFKNRRQLQDFGHASLECAVIPHQWDPRLRPHAAGEVFRLGYFGDPRSMALWNELPEVRYIPQAEYFERSLDFSAHLNLRAHGREWLYKTNSKVVFAAGCRAVLLTTPDVGTMEELGEDYPFYTEPDRESVLSSIADLRARCGGADWTRALEILDEIRERRSVDRVTDLYCDYFRRLT